MHEYRSALIARLAAKSHDEDRGYATPCRIWEGAATCGAYSSWYARLKFRGVRQLVHRWAWIAHRGPIPRGLVIDHLCEQTLCINPDHLEPVTLRENTQRGARRRRARATA